MRSSESNRDICRLRKKRNDYFRKLIWLITLHWPIHQTRIERWADVIRFIEPKQKTTSRGRFARSSVKLIGRDGASFSGPYINYSNLGRLLVTGLQLVSHAPCVVSGERVSCVF